MIIERKNNIVGKPKTTRFVKREVWERMVEDGRSYSWRIKSDSDMKPEEAELPENIKQYMIDFTNTEYSKKTIPELKKLLDFKSIKYNKSDKKKDLIKKLSDGR